MVRMLRLSACSILQCVLLQDKWKRQEEFSQQMEEAREGVLQEEAEEARNPTVEEFMQGAEEEEESSVGTESD